MMNDFDKKQIPVEQHDSYLNYSYWLIERWEKFNEELDMLSVYLIGFLALEIALVGQIDKSSMNEMKFFFIAALLALIISIILFFKILQSAEFGIHGKKDLKRQIDRLKGGDKTQLLDYLLNDHSETDIFGSFEREVDASNIYYPWAIRLAILGQLLLAFSIIGNWTGLSLAVLFN